MKQTRFSSIAEFAGVSKGTPWYASGSGSSWDGGISHVSAATLAVVGDTTYPPRAEALLDQIQADVEVSTASWQPSVYGAYPVVAEFLAGSPTPMRHKVLVASEYAPMSIWVDLTCSGGFSADQMLARGVAILALVLKLQTIRPVSLKLVSCITRLNGGLVIDVESQPMEVATAAFALCAVAFVRHLVYGYMEFRASDSPVSNPTEIRRKLNIADGDLVIPGGYLADRAIVANPVKWVQDRVNQFTSGCEVEA